ncbi:hypothetical protein K2173_002788 [Erythroxylum novogranatense]|uniref:Receptor-like serine/threonine-protein kinase n=1 Tax=Erythroxylum novogranatense TaxID=1862640 RepID=A0AAV8SPY6_9ROSI|nr:hypothetical protein K2173_002788 [Erythroxylum novogranatense]
MMETTARPCILLLFLICFSYAKIGFSVGGDRLSLGQGLYSTQTLVSQNGFYELGFFTRGSLKPAPLPTYLGIWYKNFADKIYVWEANRENPLLDPASLRLELSSDGNIVLIELNRTAWSTSVTSKVSNSTEAVLLDSGNFVIRDDLNPSTVYWQSFDYPTDIWLPGAKLGIDKRNGREQRLISWKNSEDPSPGLFSLGVDLNGDPRLFLEWNNSVRYWTSGPWNGSTFSLIPENSLRYIDNISFISNENESYFVYYLRNSSTLSRFKLNISGMFLQLSWLAPTWQWDLVWMLPINLSDVYALCGAFGVIYKNSSRPCKCLKGFTAYSTNDWSTGCTRNTPLQCQRNDSTEKTEDQFLLLSNLTFPANSKAYNVASAAICKLNCMEDCLCTAYAYNNSGCFIWEGDLMNLQEIEEVSETVAQHIYIRLAASELGNPGESSKKRILWVIAPVFVAVAVLTLVVYKCWQCLGKLRNRGEQDKSEDLLLFDFSADQSLATRESKSPNILNKRGKKDVELPLFSRQSVSAATNRFSVANKLGEGGYGPVYKGMLRNGQEIAVKRLSKRSGQGLEEFRNETLLIAKLQHRNLVRLLGCCIEQEENILIYEYMPNKSLDFFLFDPARGKILTWDMRVLIIEGVAQGLLYLHQYSRFRIIHRDLKPSNILLDSDMKPKISDFGMARIFGGNETQANTNRIVGTYGYMSPEYAMDGLFSVKSDVFSFGVLLLEILSGKKSTGLYHNDSLNLLGYVWELWSSNRGLELMDPTLGDPPSTSMVLRYINIGLLCVQEKPSDRPTMSDVISMIINEHAPLSTPKQPAFYTSVMVKDSSPDSHSANNVTLSIVEAR